MPELLLLPFEAIEFGAAEMARQGFSPIKIAKELGEAASRDGATVTANAIRECHFEINRQGTRGNRYRNALKALLFSLHARPLFGGPHLSLEDAIAEANALIDGEMPGGGG